MTCPTAGIDSATLTAAAAATSGRMVIAEGHHPEGGLASAVTDSLLAAARSNLSLAHLARARQAGRGRGRLAWAGVDADHIVAATHKLIDPAWPVSCSCCSPVGELTLR